MSALDRLKHIQANFKQSWKGIKIQYSGRPGTASITNKKRPLIPNTEEQNQESLRNS